MKPLRILAGLLSLAALAPTGAAQHCAPIYQSFLSEVSVRWVDDAIRIRLEYTKDGGAWPRKEAYQAYLIAYREKDAARVPTPKDQDILAPEATVVLHTQRMKLREGDGEVYGLDYTISARDLSERVVKGLGLGEEDREESGHWYRYRDRIRLAVFIPFLADEKYSVLEGLPEERHECNYRHARALLFQPLTHALTLRKGRGEEGKDRYWVMINSLYPSEM